MLHTYSAQYTFYASHLLQTLKKISKQTAIQDIYLSQRCSQLIINQRITDVDLFGCGYKKIHLRKSISPYLKLDKIVIVANINQEEFQEINEIQYLFPEVFLLTLNTTNGKNAVFLKKSPILKALRAVKEINLNFFTFLDNAHFVSKMQKSHLFEDPNSPLQPYKYKRPSSNKKISSYCSFLLSYPKIYQYELHYVKNQAQSYNLFVKELQNELQQSLSVLQKHQEDCKNFDKVSSPKIKFLVLNRQIINDLISPLLYGYYYGPLCEEFINRQKLIQGADKLSNKGKMYNKLFEKDFDQSSEFIQTITKDKTILEGPYESKDTFFYKAKHMIANFEDPSPIELALHITCWQQTRKFGETRLKAAILQQNIANRNDEFDRKVSNGDCVSQIIKWIIKSDDKQEKWITQDQYLKLAMLAQITGSLWFYQRNSLKKCIYNEQNKTKYNSFLSRRQQVPTHNLTEKYQLSQQQRSQLYRHEPRLIPVCQKWLKLVLGLDQKQQKLKSIPNQGMRIQFDKKCINNDISKNRDSKFVIIIDGFVGYNELALLRRMIKGVTEKQITIVAESFCNSQQYADYMMRP